jgi:hypothetical protein
MFGDLRRVKKSTWDPPGRNLGYGMDGGDFHYHRLYYLAPEYTDLEVMSWTSAVDRSGIYRIWKVGVKQPWKWIVLEPKLWEHYVIFEDFTAVTMKNVVFWEPKLYTALHRRRQHSSKLGGFELWIFFPEHFERKYQHPLNFVGNVVQFKIFRSAWWFVITDCVVSANWKLDPREIRIC